MIYSFAVVGYILQYLQSWVSLCLLESDEMWGMNIKHGKDNWIGSWKKVSEVRFGEGGRLLFIQNRKERRTPQTKCLKHTEGGGRRKIQS